MTLDRLGEVLLRMGAELDRVADRLRAVMLHLDVDPSASTPPSSSRIVGLQDVDAMEQTVRELAVALKATASTEAATIPVDVDRLAAGLRLSAIEDVIRGVTAAPTRQTEVDFFD